MDESTFVGAYEDSTEVIVQYTKQKNIYMCVCVCVCVCMHIYMNRFMKSVGKTI